MGEAQQKERERFTPGIVEIIDPATQVRLPCYVAPNGLVYKVRLSGRVPSEDIAELARQAARNAGRSSSRILRPQGGLVLPK